MLAPARADGGSENHALTIQQLLDDTSHLHITKIVALKDIAFSNSPIEAIHKIMKRYLRRQLPYNEKQLDDYIQQNVYDYNFIRPHGSLKGYTPIEAYSQNKPELNFSSQIALAKSVRCQQNKVFNCSTCL